MTHVLGVASEVGLLGGASVHRPSPEFTTSDLCPLHAGSLLVQTLALEDFILKSVPNILVQQADSAWVFTGVSIDPTAEAAGQRESITSRALMHPDTVLTVINTPTCVRYPDLDQVTLRTWAITPADPQDTRDTTPTGCSSNPATDLFVTVGDAFGVVLAPDEDARAAEREQRERCHQGPGRHIRRRNRRCDSTIRTTIAGATAPPSTGYRSAPGASNLKGTH